MSSEAGPGRGLPPQLVEAVMTMMVMGLAVAQAQVTAGDTRKGG